MDEFALQGMGFKDTIGSDRDGMTKSSELVELFSDKTSKNIVNSYKKNTTKGVLTKVKELATRVGAVVEETEDIKVKILSRLNVIQHFKPPLGQSIFSFHKKRANNPFYLKYGKPTDEKLAEVIAKIPKSQTENTPKNLGFSLQYGKYKMKALESLGLNPKVITPSEENGLTFIEIEFPKNTSGKEELLEKLERAEIDLYSQYMPMPNFNEVSEEEINDST
jgi:hypothetical protein